MTVKTLESLLNSYLQLDKHVAGIKLYTNRDDFQQLEVQQRKNKSYYCQLVKMAVNGKMWKADITNFACETSAKLLGLEPFYDKEEGIDGWYMSGLYHDRTIATTEHEAVRPLDEATVGIQVGPLVEFQETPDVVIIVCKPYQAMRIIQGYTYHYGFKSDFQLSGMCGVCFESTVIPLKEKTISVSLLCSGTRYVCKWPEDYMMVALPFEMAEKIMDGIVQTAEATEPDHYKDGITSRLRAHKIKNHGPLTHGKGYFYRKK